MAHKAKTYGREKVGKEYTVNGWNIYCQPFVKPDRFPVTVRAYGELGRVLSVRGFQTVKEAKTFCKANNVPKG